MLLKLFRPSGLLLRISTRLSKFEDSIIFRSFVRISFTNSLLLAITARSRQVLVPISPSVKADSLILGWRLTMAIAKSEWFSLLVSI